MVEGEHHLLEAERVEDCKEGVEQTLNSFTAFLLEANVSQLLSVDVFFSLAINGFSGIGSGGMTLYSTIKGNNSFKK